MKAVFVDTYRIKLAQDGELDSDAIAPIIVYDLETNEAERTREVSIVGNAHVRFDMAPAHNLARVWIEADESALEYDGDVAEWEVRRRDG